MSDQKPLYLYSLSEALKYNERDLWRDSYRENCDCARAIERAIADAYDHDTSTLGDCVQPILDRYGFNRVNWVLANTIREKDSDGRISQENKEWARQFRIPKEDTNWHFSVEAHPGLTNLFVNQARRAWQPLGLYDASHCLSERDGELDYTGKVVVLRPDILKDAYKTPEDQLFLAESGFGCSPNSRGRKVFGTFLKDGEKTHFYRDDIIGILQDKYLPEWAAERLAEMWISEADEADSLTMGGL